MGGRGGVNKTHYGLCEIGELAANMNGVADREEGGHARPSSRVSSTPKALPRKFVCNNEQYRFSVKTLTPSLIQPSVSLVQLHDGPVQLPKQLQLPQIHSPRSEPVGGQQNNK